MKANVKADGKCFLCPDASGKITINDIVISTQLLISAQNGKAKVSMKNTTVLLEGLDVDVNGILGSLFDFIVDFIVDEFKPSLIKAFKEELGKAHLKSQKTNLGNLVRSDLGN